MIEIKFKACVFIGLICQLLPVDVLAGPNVWSQIGPEGGYVSIAVDDSDANLVYAASSNGIHKSTNGAATWAYNPVAYTATQSYVAIRAVHTVPGITKTLYAEAAIGGVLKSLDGGLTWISKNDGVGGGVSAFAVDPLTPSTVYRASTSVFRSTDGGETWVGGAAGLPVNAEFTCITVDPVTPNVVFLGRHGGVSKSIDNGLTWVEVPIGMQSFEAANKIVIDANSHNTVYAAGSSKLYKSIDGGASWASTVIELGTLVSTVIISPNNSNLLFAGTQGSATQGLYKSLDSGGTWQKVDIGSDSIYVKSIAISKNTPSTMYISSSRGIFKSSDRGVSWSAANKGLNASYVQAIALDPSDPRKIVAGTNGSGLFKSSDGGTTWERLGFTNQNIRSVSIDPSVPLRIYVGTNEDGLYRSSDGGSTWSRTALVNRSVPVIWINPKLPSTLFVASGGIFKSTDYGETWLDITPALSIHPLGAMAVNPNNPDVIYVASVSAEYFKTTDGGRNWSSMTNGLSGNGGIRALTIDPQESSTLYASLGRVYKSTDSGANWYQTGSMNGGTIEGFAIDPTNPSTLYVSATGTGISISKDRGETWKAINIGLTDFDVPSIAIHPLLLNTVYAGTIFGSIFSMTFSPIQFLSPPSTDGVVGKSLLFDFSADGAINNVDFEIESGTLPTGLSLALGRFLQGVPTSVGSFQVRIRANDGVAFAGFQNFSVNIAKSQTTVSLSPPTTPISAGKSTTLFVRVVGFDATGTVSVRDGEKTLGTANIQRGSGVLDASFLPGTHTLSLDYSGDASNEPSTSSSSIVVEQSESSSGGGGGCTINSGPQKFDPIALILLLYAVSMIVSRRRSDLSKSRSKGSRRG